MRFVKVNRLLTKILLYEKTFWHIAAGNIVLLPQH
jgi:hypothetical protein